MLPTFTMILFLLFSIISITVANAQSLYKIEKNGLYGYMDVNGKNIIQCNYIHAYTDTIKNLGFVFDQKSKKIICFNNKGDSLFYVVKCDNGPDYIRNGLFRIMDRKGLIGFSDSLGNIVIKPKFKFAYPFYNNRARVTQQGKYKKVPKSKGEKHYWDSKKWFYIDKKGVCVENSNK